MYSGHAFRVQRPLGPFAGHPPAYKTKRHSFFRLLAVTPQDYRARFSVSVQGSLQFVGTSQARGRVTASDSRRLGHVDNMERAAGVGGDGARIAPWDRAHRGGAAGPLV